MARPNKGADINIELKHDADILFTFVMNGSMELSAAEYDASTLKTGDAFTVPPDLTYSISECSDDLELLEVALPGKFQTSS